uniref:RNA-directed RNA polymerase catalytic subunit n=1 Tax=Longchuang virus TaxID=2486715 RepID=A0A565D443_9ORTO|nr:polymerase PB1 [Longchuang virus]
MLSSFLCSTLIKCGPVTRQEIRERTRCQRENLKEEQKTISAVSLLYQYTNTPPLAHGSPAPKVAESVLRSQEYNSLPNNGRNFTNKTKDRQYWDEEDGDYPTDFSKPTSNISLPHMKLFCEQFIQKYSDKIDICARRLLDEARTTNSSILTRGRQTWEPFTQRSVTSPDAYKETLEFFEKNLNRSNYNMLEWIQAWSQLFEKEAILCKRKRTILNDKKRIFTSAKGTFVNASKHKVVEEWVKLTGDEKDSFLLQIASEFCSYLKSKERSKLKRRAIASANPILRMFFELIERFHLDLGKEITGSTISIGGIEKQTKIMQGLTKIGTKDSNILATEDATKWNECLSPAGFLVMHDTFFDPDIRKRLGRQMKLSEEEIALIKEIFHTGIFLLSQKTVHLSTGHIIQDEKTFTRPQWYKLDPNILNQKTREWYLKCERDINDRECIYSPYGMLMGMLNAASTTYGLLPTIGMTEAASIRSSDDSITLFVGSSAKRVWHNVKEMYMRYKLVGINISLKKTRFFQWPFGEYTSWYIDGEFSAQYGVEISAIRPNGDTPHTDFHAAAIDTSVSLREFRINNIGAEMMLAAKIANTRRLWRIERNPDKRIEQGVGEDVLLLADGGNSPWHSTNCHLHEIPIKEAKANTIQEKEYLLKIMNIDNPFSDRGERKTIILKVRRNDNKLSSIHTQKYIYLCQT